MIPAVTDCRRAGREVEEELSIPRLLARIRQLEAELSSTQRAHEALRLYVLSRPWDRSGDGNATEALSCPTKLVVDREIL